MEEEKKVSTVQNGPNEKTNLLKKSKYTFFIILSYCCSRTEGRMLLHKISKRGQMLRNDKDLEILVPLTFTYELRHPSQIAFLERFTEAY
jgi:hypothetical protein